MAWLVNACEWLMEALRSARAMCGWRWRLQEDGCAAGPGGNPERDALECVLLVDDEAYPWPWIVC